jgi:phosphatidylserine decarboxylase
MQRSLPKAVLQRVISSFVRHFNVDLSDVERPLASFTSMDDFFTRSLRPGTRPIGGNEGDVVSCADGVVCAWETITRDGLLQAKGHHYRTEALLGDRDLAADLLGGTAHTIYLAPPDYHRVHCPFDGLIVAYRYIPGRLFPVHPISRTHVPNLFSRNERVVIELETETGRAAVVLVGATFVGQISLAFADLRTNQRQGPDHHFVRLEAAIPIHRGDHLGTFHMGSTVVVLQSEARSLCDEKRVGNHYQMGSLLASAS